MSSSKGSGFSVFEHWITNQLFPVLVPGTAKASNGRVGDATRALLAHLCKDWQAILHTEPVKKESKGIVFLFLRSAAQSWSS